MVTLMLSLLSFLVERVRHPAEKRAHAHLAHPLHHFFHFQKLFHQAVDVGDRGTAPLSDAAAPAAVQCWRVAPFFLRHRVDDGFSSFYFFLCLLRITWRGEFFSARNHLEKPPNGAHALDLLE